jgi:hypothetical protein
MLYTVCRYVVWQICKQSQSIQNHGCVAVIRKERLKEAISCDCLLADLESYHPGFYRKDNVIDPTKKKSKDQNWDRSSQSTSIVSLATAMAVDSRE